jgi:hypothetical protein
VFSLLFLGSFWVDGYINTTNKFLLFLIPPSHFIILCECRWREGLDLGEGNVRDGTLKNAIAVQI